MTILIITYDYLELVSCIHLMGRHTVVKTMALKKQRMKVFVVRQSVIENVTRTTSLLTAYMHVSFHTFWELISYQVGSKVISGFERHVTNIWYMLLMTKPVHQTSKQL